MNFIIKVVLILTIWGCLSAKARETPTFIIYNQKTPDKSITVVVVGSSELCTLKIDREEDDESSTDTFVITKNEFDSILSGLTNIKAISTRERSDKSESVAPTGWHHFIALNSKVFIIPETEDDPEFLEWKKMITTKKETTTVRKVEPLPEGCIGMSFYDPSDDRFVLRNDDGNIKAVITPIMRCESLDKRWSHADFEKAVMERQLSPSEELQVPGEIAWKYAKKHLLPTDELWTFGWLDSGTVVIRDGKLYCLIVVEHQM